MKLYWIACLVTFMLLGCGGEDHGTPVDVSGKITMGSQPVDGATVTFHTVEKGLPATLRTKIAKTDAEGKYTMSEVYPAKYQVSVQKFSGGEIDPSKASAAGPMANDPLAKYGDESPLAADVSTEKSTFDFDL